MSKKKRTSAEANNDEQANEGSESQSESEHDAKRAKLGSPSNTTLQGLPIEPLGLILIHVIVTEVKAMKLAKCAWKEKADLVINRLTPVCSQFRSTLTTNAFRNELHRVLDGTVEATIGLKILREVSMNSTICSVTTTKDYIFTLGRRSHYDQTVHTIHVYDISTHDVKDVIPLKDSDPAWMAACNVANCLYVGLRNKTSSYLSVFRISRDAEQKFTMSPWIQDHRGCISMMSVSANGNLIILSVQTGCPHVVSMYNANGSLQHEIMLSPVMNVLSYMSVIQKSNGNVVLACITEQNPQVELLEIDTGGSIVRQYHSSMREGSYVNSADVYGRIMITDQTGGIELLDSELNPLGTYSLLENGIRLFEDLRYTGFNGEMNEIACIGFDKQSQVKVLTVFRFAEEWTI